MLYANIRRKKILKGFRAPRFYDTGTWRNNLGADVMEYAIID